MCTVTVVKDHKGHVILTHNRDEAVTRQSTKVALEQKSINGHKVYMPLDLLSGGTWIGSNGIWTAAILNGYKVKHVRKLPYSKSRGLIIPSLFEIGDLQVWTTRFDFRGVEAFTLIVYDSKHVHEIGWDESELHWHKYDTSFPLLWSSCTLYSPQIIAQRYNMFVNSIKDNATLIAEDVLAIHKRYGEDHGQYLNVQVTPSIKTVAISQVNHPTTSGGFYYEVL